MREENNPMHGKTHDDKTKLKLSKKMHKHNPMSGKIWICNYELKQAMAWDKAKPLSDGWTKGRHSKEAFEKLELKNAQLEERKQKKMQQMKEKACLLHEMFEEFKKTEFAGVVKKFVYPYTRNNLIMMFKKHVPEYVPQECNRWKANVDK